MMLTLCLLEGDGRVLLGMKKRGFGAGNWNGFGGKVGADESIEAAACRELKEEADLDALPEDLEKVGVLDFSFEGEPGILNVHVFRVLRWRGEPKETEEMRPRWFSADAIPYGEMWADDRYWFPLFLAGKRFAGRFHFSSDGTVASHELEEYAGL